ncbi:MAG: hypothetical protein ACREEA_05180 [Stellaceae bacterium]
MQTTKFNRRLRALFMAGAMAAAAAGAIATPALADNDNWHGRGGWGEHAWHHDDDDWRRGPVYGYSYGYNTYPYAYYPYAYAAPAPVYAAPPAVGFYFGFR